MKLQLTKKKLKQLSGYQILDSKMTTVVKGANGFSGEKAPGTNSDELTSMDARDTCLPTFTNRAY